MKYELTDYQGNSLILPADKASKIAGVANLIEVEVNGQTHFINPSNIASIKPTSIPDNKHQRLEASNTVDNRGTISNEQFQQFRKKVFGTTKR